MKGEELARFEREDRIWELRLQGKSLRAIGDEIGLSHMQVGNILNARLATMVHPKVDEYRKVMWERCETLIGFLWDKARAGEYGAHSMINKHQERQAKLCGLDSPVEISLGLDEPGKPWMRIWENAGYMDLTAVSEDELIEELRSRRSIESKKEP